MLVMKKNLLVQAFRLGSGTCMERALIQNGLLRDLGDGFWEVRTREALYQGEIVPTGDYIKIDTTGMPYPNEKTWFEKNHEHVKENWFRQKNEPMKAWRKGEPWCDEMDFVLEKGLLRCNPSDPAHTYRGELWGTPQTAAADAVIVFDCIERDIHGNLITVKYHFVAGDEFAVTYDILSFCG